jgi:hypothetical protein
LSKSRVERDSDVFAFDESSIIQALPKGIDNICEAGSRGASEKSDHRHRRLLRARRQRLRSRRAAEKRDEFAASHLLLQSQENPVG